MKTPNKFTSFMNVALEEARAAAARGEVPVGACIVDPATGEVIARDGNRTREIPDPTAHAEVNVIRTAAKERGKERLEGLDIYVTLEPCAACAASISAARLSRLYFGAYDPKSGGIEQGARVFSHPQTHHKPDVYGGISERECAALLEDFFGKKR